MRTVKLTCCFLTVFLFILPGFKRIEKPVIDEIIQLDNNREIFVDHYLIDNLKEARLVMHTPNDEGVKMYFDKPWEGPISAYFTIINDNGLFRLYYRGMPEAGKDGSSAETTCYAESKDGINWEKPVLGLFEVSGTYENNVILANAAPVTHNFSPFKDTNPNASPDQKFKALGGGSRSGLIPYVSADGIKWERLHDEGVITKGAFDSQNVSFWSESEEMYVCYFRTWSGGGYKGFRTVARATSKDFINWTEPVDMTYGDNPPEHIYTQQTSPYFRAPHIYVAIGARFMPDRQILTEEQLINLQVDPSQFKGLSEPFFMTTRGGNVYDRTFMEAYIRPGTRLNNWTGRTNYPVLNVVQTGPEEMSVYVNQDYAQPTAHLRRYSMRLDGFTSIKAPYSGGEVITKPFVFSGDKLEINYSTSAAGEISIEIQDINGNPIQGFTMDDAQTIIGNEIERIVSWGEDENLGELDSQPVRLRIYMKDANLYSLKFR